MGTVAVRPYSAETAAAEVEMPKRERKVFRPKPPIERRVVQKSLLSSATGGQDTVRSLLQDAERRQEVQALRPGARPNTPERFQGMELRKFGIGATTSSSSKAPSGAPGMSAASIPRKLKEKGSLDLMDLPFAEQRRQDGQLRPTYAPVSLPFYNVEEGDIMENDKAAAKQHIRPALMHIDEKNSNAAKELFLGEDGELMEDTIFLMQFPSVLPELVDDMDEVQQDDDPNGGATINRLPDGLLGKLRIHKSGKVSMDIGGLPFCVDQGCRTFFHQDLVCVCPGTNEVIDMGAIAAKAVVTPDMEQMLSATS